MGLSGNLLYAEILEQVVHAERILAQEALERRALQQQIPTTYEHTTTTTRTGGDKNRIMGARDQKPSKAGKGKKNASDLDVVRNIVFMGQSNSSRFFGALSFFVLVQN